MDPNQDIVPERPQFVFGTLQKHRNHWSKIQCSRLFRRPIRRAILTRKQEFEVLGSQNLATSGMQREQNPQLLAFPTSLGCQWDCINMSDFVHDRELRALTFPISCLLLGSRLSNEDSDKQAIEKREVEDYPLQFSGLEGSRAMFFCLCSSLLVSNFGSDRIVWFRSDGMVYDSLDHLRWGYGSPTNRKFRNFTSNFMVSSGCLIPPLELFSITITDGGSHCGPRRLWWTWCPASFVSARVMCKYPFHARAWCTCPGTAVMNPAIPQSRF